MFSLALLKDWLGLLPYRNMFGHALTVYNIWTCVKHAQTCFVMSGSGIDISRIYICLYLLEIWLILYLKCREMHAWVMSRPHKAQKIPWTCVEHTLICLNLAVTCVNLYRTCLELFWCVWTHLDAFKTCLDTYELCLLNDWWSCLDTSETHQQ